MRIYTPATALSLAVALSAGCGNKDGDNGDTDDTTDQDQTGDQTVEVFEGLGYWFLEMTPDPDRNVNSQDCTENFSEAECRTNDGGEGDTAWTNTSDFEASPMASVAQILKGKDGKYFLYWNGQLFPGEKVGGSDDGGDDDTDASLREGSAEFEFGWWGTTDSSSGSEHASGYKRDYSEAEGGGYNFKLELDLDAGTVTGEFDETYERTRTWEESDEWESQVPTSSSGWIPAPSYLQLTDGGEGSVRNFRTEDNCSGNTCEITITEQSRLAYAISGSFVSQDEGQGIDDDIDGLGWSDGVPND